MKNKKINKIVSKLAVTLTLITILVISLVPTASALGNNSGVDAISMAVVGIQTYGSNYDYAMSVTSTYGFGDVLFAEAPEIRVLYASNATHTQEGSIKPKLYLSYDDNADSEWYWKVIDSTGTYKYPVKYTNIYLRRFGTDFPLIYNQNIQTFGNNISTQMSEGFDIWLPFNIGDSEMYWVPQDMRQDFMTGYTDAQMNQAREEAYAQGKADGEQIIYEDKTTLLDFISAIFTAPAYLVNTIFDFDIFGFNVAQIIRVLFTLCIVGFVLVFFIKKGVD